MLGQVLCTKTESKPQKSKKREIVDAVVFFADRIEWLWDLMLENVNEEFEIEE